MLENQAFASYTEYTTEIHHQHDEGISVSAIAGDDDEFCSLTRLYSPIEFIQVFWTATREGAPPVLPSHKSYLGNYNRTFLGGARNALIVPIQGGHSFSVSGVYVYAVNFPEGLDSAFALGKCPWEGAGNDNAKDYYVPTDSFVLGLLNPQSPETLPLGLAAATGPMGAITLVPPTLTMASTPAPAPPVNPDVPPLNLQMATTP